jgi:hypothetical protein
MGDEDIFTVSQIVALATFIANVETWPNTSSYWHDVSRQHNVGAILEARGAGDATDLPIGPCAIRPKMHAGAAKKVRANKELNKVSNRVAQVMGIPKWYADLIVGLLNIKWPYHRARFGLSNTLLHLMAWWSSGDGRKTQTKYMKRFYTRTIGMESVPYYGLSEASAPIIVAKTTYSMFFAMSDVKKMYLV